MRTRVRALLLVMLIYPTVVPVEFLARPGFQYKMRLQSSTQAAVVVQGEAGLKLLKRDQFPQAIDDLRGAVQREPRSWSYSLALAEALLCSNYNFTGLRFLLKVKPRFQNLAEYRYILGLAYYRCYRYAEAIKEFEMLPQNDPRLSRVPFLVGNCYMAMGDLKTATAHFRRAIELDPTEDKYYVALAKILRMEGPEHNREAISALNKALSLNPQNPYARLHLAYCEMEDQDYKDAETNLEQLVRDRPKLQPARLALASIYDHEHDWAKVMKQRAIAARLKPPKQFVDSRLGPVATAVLR